MNNTNMCYPDIANKYIICVILDVFVLKRTYVYTI